MIAPSEMDETEEVLSDKTHGIVGVTYAGPPTSNNFNSRAFGEESCIGGNTVEGVHSLDSHELGKDNWEQAVQTMKNLVLASLYIHKSQLSPEATMNTEPQAIPGFAGVETSLEFARMSGISRPNIFPQEENHSPSLSSVDRIVYQKDILANDIRVVVSGDRPEDEFRFTINPDTIYMLEKHHLLQKGDDNPYSLTGAQLKILLSRFNEDEFDSLVNAWITEERQTPDDEVASGQETLLENESDAAAAEKENPDDEVLQIGGDIWRKKPGGDEFVLSEKRDDADGAVAK